MLAFVKLKRLFRENDYKKYKHIAIGSIREHLLKIIIIYLVAFDLAVMLSVRVHQGLGSIVMFILTMICAFIAFCRSVGIGINDDTLMFIRLKTFKFEAKKVFEIPFDKIRSITVKKGLLNTSLKISFISNEGKLEKQKYVFSTFILGNNEQQDNARKLTTKLMEIQKVIDKGDF